MTEAAGSKLDLGLAVVVEGLSRRSSAAPAEYTPATPVLHRIFRREWLEIPLAEDAGVDDDDSDDELAEEEEEEEEEAREEVAEDLWALKDVSFVVPRGTALALVGPAAGGRVLLLRVLAGYVPPTAGRAVIRGRRGPTVEAASRLMRRDMHPDQNLKLLAGLVGVSRGERERFVQELLDLALGPRNASSGRDFTNVFAKVAAASALDPTADVLLIDRLPVGDRRFRNRCLDQLSRALARGATALISVDDPALAREVATDALWLERGSVAVHGPVADVVRELEHFEEGPGGRHQRRAPRPFDERAAILELGVTSGDGSVVVGDDLEVAVVFETLEPDATVTLRLRARDDLETLELGESGPTPFDEMGRYGIVATVPALLPEGEHRLELEASVVAGGMRSTIARSMPLTVRPDSGDVPEVTQETVGEAGPSPEWEPENVEAEWTVSRLDD
jgi:ABC-type polysaccharide/polyol phosphate transport system ATPase subunit